MKFVSTCLLTVAALVVPGVQSQPPFSDCSREYVALFQNDGIEFKLFDTLLATGTRGNPILQGSAFAQTGFLANPEDIEIKESPGNFPGNVQPFDVGGGTPFARDQFYTVSGQCVATSVDEKSGSILAHSCFNNLCLGAFDTEDGLFYNCINYYAGSPFVFNPIEEENSSTPSLPPSYPGTIIGGIGAFVGIEGSVEVITVTGRDSNNVGFITQRIFLTTNQELPDVPNFV